MINLDYDALKLLVIFLFTIIIHELGHYLAFRYYKYKPNVNFTWLYISIGDNCYKKLTLKQWFSVLYWGIFSGIIFFTLFDGFLTKYYFMLGLCGYILACIIDIYNIIIIFHLKKTYKGVLNPNVNIVYDYMYKDAVKTIEEYKNSVIPKND